MKQTYRIFWNITAGEGNQWCIDTGVGTERRWATNVMFACLTQTRTRPSDSKEHPRGWIEAIGNIRELDNGVVLIK